ncbi:YcnI family protein [Streptomyces sp. NBC_01485]|uniref:DUF1775 domain-containing protein n=1 Tax=Streptomyces sp. NBC_01485 TaxID=2903884 RepID=UPI002E3533B5|nr:DUF1775 domain-containing protein [Streptomyces sp. NBC_01485]
MITVAASAAGAVLLSAGPGAAHIRVIGDVIPGKPATLQFRVPSELADATTVRIAVAVPPEIAVTAVPTPDGWTEQTIAGSTGQGLRLVWTAEAGHEIRPADSRIFKVKVGPIPDQYSVTFNTEQTYSNGTIATWNEKQTGSKEPEFPAPVLVIDPDAGPPPGSAGDSPQPATTESPAPDAGPTPAPSVAAAPADSAAAGQTGPSAGLLTVIGAGMVAVATIAAAAVRQRRRRNGMLRS